MILEKYAIRKKVWPSLWVTDSLRTNSFTKSNFRPGCFISESEKVQIHGRGGRPSILKDTAIPTVFNHFGPPKKKRRAFENIDEKPENLEVQVIFNEIVTLFLKLNQSGTANCH